MIGILPLNQKTGLPEVPESPYNPSQAVKDITKLIKQDYQLGYDNQHRTYREFNDRTLLTILSDDQKAFNTYTPPKSSDPREAWRWNGVRPSTRNKIISLAAHLTQQIQYPTIFAQSRSDEEDKEAAEVMKELVTHLAENSDYEVTMLFATIAGLVNPAVILEAKYETVLQEVKQRAENGTITKKQVVDEILSGFKSCIVPVEELLIENFYEYELQKQRFIIRKRCISYSLAKARYGDHENFVHVKPGTKAVFNDTNETFYDVMDDELRTLVEECVYYNRLDDIEIPFVNGVYLGEKNVGGNLFKHRRLTLDVKGEIVSVPVYPYAKSGHEPIDEKRFFYYKSAVSKLFWDQALTDRLWQMVVDGTFLSVMKPIITSGAGRIDDTVIFPGQVTSLPKDATVTPLDTRSGLSDGLNILNSLEASMSESSQDKLRGGQEPSGNPTATELSLIQQNARVQLGLFGKMLASLVEEFGKLIVDCVIQHMTTDEMMQLVSADAKKNLSFITRRTEEGKNIVKKIVFQKEMVGKEYAEEELEDAKWALLEEEGGMDGNMRIYKVNPYLFARLKYYVKVTADSMIPMGVAYERAEKLEGYDRMIQNPLLDPETVTRDFLVEVYAKGDTDKYMKKMDEMQGLFGAPGTPPGQTPAKGMVSKMAGTNSPRAVMSEVPRVI